MKCDQVKTFGTVSYNIYCNFTNYGSALQTWALNQAIQKLGYHSKLVDYCPEILADKDPLNPFSNMWDKDEESRKMCELTLPAIRENYKKFDSFYRTEFDKTKKYTSANFNDSVDEVDGYVCGSDTIFCTEEFGFDDGYFANYDCMKNGYAIAYAASFGDPHFDDTTYPILNDRLQNFRALGIREKLMIPYVQKHTNVPVQKVLDPTLLLEAKEYADITQDKRTSRTAEKYLLLYSRRYNRAMEDYAISLAKQNGWQIIEISLRATNAEKGHIMAYDAGVEEFLSLVKNAEFVVTNSFHGMIFSVQFQRDFVVFSRHQCDTKINELLELFGLSDRMMLTGEEQYKAIDYKDVHQRISKEREKSLLFLKTALDGINK